MSLGRHGLKALLHNFGRRNGVFGSPRRPLYSHSKYSTILPLLSLWISPFPTPPWVSRVPQFCLGRSSFLPLVGLWASRSNRVALLIGTRVHCGKMAAPRRYCTGLVRALLGPWQVGSLAGRERVATPGCLLGRQVRCVSSVVGATFSGPLLAPASSRYGEDSALDRILGFPQPDSSLVPSVPAVSVHRGKGSSYVSCRYSVL